MPYRFTLKSKPALSFAIFAALAATPIVSGQAKKTAGRAAAKTSESSGGAGLNSLSDDALYTDLAARQMQQLLNHAFEANKVPESQRAAMLAIPAINRIGDLENPPREFERAQLIERVRDGADRVVSGVDSPDTLLELSAKLIKGAVDPESNLIEYWGETPKVQRRLGGAIDAVMKLLDKAVKTGGERAEKIANLLSKGRNEKVEKEWAEADRLVTMAEFTRAMVSYNKAMSIPANAKGMEERKKVADEAIAFLQAYDNPDSGVQAAVRNRMGKLNLIKHEFGPANDFFESVETGKTNDKNNPKIDPAPKPEEQYEARTIGVICELMQGPTDRATKGLDELIAWQKQAVTDPKAQENLAAAAEVLRYRILLKERDKTKDPAQQKEINKKALEVLTDLSQKQPELRNIIAEQLIEVAGDNVDLKTAEPLILESLVNRGAQEAETIDDPAKVPPQIAKHAEQAIAAAQELIKRNDPKVAPRMAVQIPLLQEKLGRKLDAAIAYLDYVQKKQGTPKNITAAFNQAGYLLFQLTKNGGDKEPAVAAAWERFLPVAIDGFGHKEFAYDYANRLRDKNPPKYADAIKYYRMVPATDKRVLRARYREMITLTDWIYAVGPEKKPLLNKQEHEAKVREALKAADEVRKLSQEQIAASKDPKEQASLRSQVAVVTLTQAELAASEEKPDWQNVLKIIDGFEQQTANLDNADALNRKVMELRVAAQIQLGQTQQAAETLQALVAREPGGRAQGLVLGILQKLNDDYNRAKAAGDDARAADIIKSRAGLSGVLVDWATKHKDEKVRRNLYVYKVYDADTQRLYGESLDGADRDKQLRKAAAAFQDLQKPVNVDAYKQVVADRKKENPKDKTDPDAPDPQVTLGLALTTYDLKDWKTATTELRKLVYGRKIGTRTRTEVDAKTGEYKILPNDQYWEAVYRYYDGAVQWAKSAPDDKDAQAELNAVKTMLRRDYVAGPDEVGGTKWREEFEKLRKDLIPDLDLNGLRKPAAPGVAPASQPVVKAKR
jgi:hypothetical protein